MPNRSRGSEPGAGFPQSPLLPRAAWLPRFMRGSDLHAGIVVALVTVVAAHALLWRTPFGLRLRSAGEKPSAAESLGVSVLSMRHFGMGISGAFAGIGGAVIVFAGANRYQEGQTVGTGSAG